MGQIRFTGMATEVAQRLRDGGPDAYGCAPEVTVSDGGGNPCRHCLGHVPKGAGMLVLAYRPFDALQPYAETGPIFLCAQGCEAWAGEGFPPALDSAEYLLKGYTADQRIRYGTGKVVPRDQIEAYAASLLEQDEISCVDVRSARNNCFQARIVRAG